MAIVIEDVDEKKASFVKEDKEKKEFENDLKRLKEMQGRSELPPDQVEEMKQVEPELHDDARRNIGFKSFDLQQILGQGAFGKVYLCNLKEDVTK